MIRYPKITICGVHELEQLDLKKFSHVISIWDPEAECINEHENQFRRKLAKSAQVHFAYFDDISSPVPGRKAATLEQIREILTFSATITQRATILIHCWAGISRSAAVAYAVICQSAKSGTEQKCLDYLQKIRPKALPNSRIVTLAELALGRNGTMCAACEDLASRQFSQIDDADF